MDAMQLKKHSLVVKMIKMNIKDCVDIVEKMNGHVMMERLVWQTVQFVMVIHTVWTNQTKVA